MSLHLWATELGRGLVMKPAFNPTVQRQAYLMQNYDRFLIDFLNKINDLRELCNKPIC